MKINFQLLGVVFGFLILSHASQAENYKLETVVDGLDHPWSMAFLPNGDYLLAFISGELRTVSKSGEISEAIRAVPETYHAGQGGFFDVVLDPNFDSNQTLYLSYAKGSRRSNGTAIAKAKLRGDKLEDLETIFSVKDKKDTSAHYGGKLIFLKDGTLLLTTGDGFDYREKAQDPFNQMGKILRLNPDGSAPADNPFADGEDGDPYVYTYGHRNPQGLVLDPLSNTVYLHEHGPKGGDELNIIQAGENYGWPAATFGVNYSGAIISPHTSLDGMADPIKYWVPSIAPSGMAIYQGDAFPDWQGDLFIGALVDKEVRHIDMDKQKVLSETPLFSEIDQRIRSVNVGPDEFIYLLTETRSGNNGKLIRVRPN